MTPDPYVPRMRVPIIDETARLVRKTWRAHMPFALLIFGINALLVAPFSSVGIPFANLLRGGALSERLRSPAYALPFFAAASWLPQLLSIAASLLTLVLSYGMFMTNRDALATQPLRSFAETLAAVGRNTGRILLQILLIGVIIGMPTVMYIGIGVAAMIDVTMSLGRLVSLFMLLVVGIGMIAMFVVLMMRWCMAEQVAVNEDRWYAHALARSWRVTRGSSWRVLGYILLLGALTMAVRSILTFAFGMIGGGVMTLVGSVLARAVEAASLIVSSCMMGVLYRACKERSEGDPYPQWR